MRVRDIYDVEQDYFKWLCEQVDVDTEDRSYGLLAKDLHRTTFYSLVPHDENRAMDGISLREDYLGFINYPKYVELEGECTVLEMLVALAKRMDFETSSLDDDTNQTSHWFWVMIDNLGLTPFDDENYVRLNGMVKVDKVLSRFLERRYLRNGFGGLFPLERNRTDQRRTEIWYQMSEYLMEQEAV